MLAALLLSSPAAQALAASTPTLAQAGATVTAIPTPASATPTATASVTAVAPTASTTPSAVAATVTPVAPSATPTPLAAMSSAAAPAPAPATVTPVATPTPAAGGTAPTPTTTPGQSDPANLTPTPTATAGQPDPAADPFRDREDHMALMVGRARVTAGLLPLARSSQLDRAAIAHAQDMANRGYMDHDGPDGTPASRAAAQGYTTPQGSAWMVVETISAISDDPEGALGWWLSDAIHRRVLLHDFWREVGVGYVQGGPYGRFWVALFGCRPNVLPPVLLDGTLSIPTEACGRSSDAMGPVQSDRVGETAPSAESQDWSDYSSQEAWPAGHQAVVDMRDVSGNQLEVHAADPTGAATQSP